MTDKMKEYTDALIIIRETIKPDSKANKLIKISVRTEDVQFKALLDNLIKAYEYYIRKPYFRSVPEGSDIPINNGEWIEYIKPHKKDIIKYIEDILSLQKPQWQILAERHGWKQ